MFFDLTMYLSDEILIVTVPHNSSLCNTSKEFSNSSTNESSNDLHHLQVEKARELVWTVIVGIILTIIILVAIAGNLLVITAIVTDRNLRKAGNNFLISLAVSDTLVACLVMTFAAVNDLTHRWSFGAVFCDIWQSLDVMCCTASILNICAVSLDRYINIRKPLRYRNLVTHRRSVVAIALIWTMSALLSFLPIHFGWHRLGKTELNETLTWGETNGVNAITKVPTVGANYTSGFSESQSKPIDALSSSGSDEIPSCHLDLSAWYACVSSMISFYIPCFVMIVIYARLYRLSQRHHRFIKSVAVNNELHRPISYNLQISGGEDVGPGEEEEGHHVAVTAVANGRSPQAATDSGHDKNKQPHNCFNFHPVSMDNSRRCSDSLSYLGVESASGNRSLIGDLRTSTTIPSRRSSDFDRSVAKQRMHERRLSTSNGLLSRQTDHKAAITVGCIIGIFLFCWGPFFVINIIGSVWQGTVPLDLYTFLTWLGYINSCANPVIYGVTNVEFRRAFIRILTGRCFASPRRSQYASGDQNPAGQRRGVWSDNNNYHEVRTNDSLLLPVDEHR